MSRSAQGVDGAALATSQRRWQTTPASSVVLGSLPSLHRKNVDGAEVGVLGQQIRADLTERGGNLTI